MSIIIVRNRSFPYVVLRSVQDDKWIIYVRNKEHKNINEVNDYEENF